MWHMYQHSLIQRCSDKECVTIYVVEFHYDHYVIMSQWNILIEYLQCMYMYMYSWMYNNHV